MIGGFIMSKIPNGHEIISLFESMYPEAFGDGRR